MKQVLLPPLVLLTTLLIGIAGSHPFTPNSELLFDHSVQIGQSSVEEITQIPLEASPPAVEAKCGEFDDEIDYRKILKKWLRGKIRDGAVYCSLTGDESIAYNPATIVTAEMIDLNGDGIDEIALKDNCSATGNCDMVIFERSQHAYREIFSSSDSVQVFGKNVSARFGYRDIWTRDHGSFNSGGGVGYRFNGKIYNPISCYDFEYKIKPDGTTDDDATISPRRCPKRVR